MMRGMFAAISGLAVHQNMLDVTANNIANVNTIGFKSERTSFEDALSQLQMAYVRIGGQAPPEAAEPAASSSTTSTAGAPPPRPPAEPQPPQSEEGGPAQRSGRLWVPGQ